MPPATMIVSRGVALAISLGFALVVATGCVRRSPSLVDPSDQAAEDALAVSVVSRNFRDVVVYLYSDSSRHRLGFASGKATTNFKVPWSWVAHANRVQLFADQVGDQTEVLSDLLQLSRGASIVWTLESELTSSNVEVY